MCNVLLHMYGLYMLYILIHVCIHLHIYVDIYLWKEEEKKGRRAREEGGKREVLGGRHLIEKSW